MKVFLVLCVTFVVLWSSGCVGSRSPLNMELDPSGTYDMVAEYSDSDMECTLTIEKDEDGYLTATWDYGDKEIYENTAVCFGDRYLAICEPGDPPMLDIFTIGDGALNGYWVEYGYEEPMRLHGVTEEGNQLPGPPVLQELTNPGFYDIRGDNPDGSYYVGYLDLKPSGRVISCDQTITPDYEPDEYYSGVGVVVDDHLVLAVSSFLCVYAPSGDDWHGVLTDYSDHTPTSEDLTYTE